MRKLWSKYKTWSKLGTEHQVYRYTHKVYRYTLAKNDQNTMCTGTGSKCTGTSLRKVPRMCVFHPFFHILIPNQLYTSNTHQNHFKFTLESLFYSIPLSILILIQTPIMNYFKNHSNMGYDPYTNQAPRFVRVCSKPYLNFLTFNHESNNKGGFHTYLVPCGFNQP